MTVKFSVAQGTLGYSIELAPSFRGDWEVEIDIGVFEDDGRSHRQFQYNSSDAGKQPRIVIYKANTLRQYEIECHFKRAHWDPGLEWNSDAPGRVFYDNVPNNPGSVHCRAVFWTGQAGTPRPDNNAPEAAYPDVTISWYDGPGVIV